MMTLCENKTTNLNSLPTRVIGLRDNDLGRLCMSASGGAFAIMSQAVIDRGGIVFGACLGDDGYVRHISVDSMDMIYLLQGSKYVHSNVGDTFAECLDYLLANRTVLYSGTPCQVSALKTYLARNGVDSSNIINFICVDLICHGTPKPELFALHQKWLASKHKADSQIKGFQFRTKKAGWGLYYYYYYYRKGKKFEVVGSASDDPYYSAFLKGFIYRDCCYKCPFARAERCGDFTIGDYWGIDEVNPVFYDSRGVSLVLINTEKANILFEESVSAECYWIESDFETAKKYNHNLVYPTIRSDEEAEIAAEVYREVDRGNYQRIFDSLLEVKLPLKSKVRKVLPLRLVNWIRKVRKA